MNWQRPCSVIFGVSNFKFGRISLSSFVLVFILSAVGGPVFAQENAAENSESNQASADQKMGANVISRALAHGAWQRPGHQGTGTARLSTRTDQAASIQPEENPLGDVTEHGQDEAGRASQEIRRDLRAGLSGHESGFVAGTVLNG